MNLGEAAALMGGEIRRPSGTGTLIEGAAGGPTVSDLSYDSRTVAPGHLFFCIRGAYADGHSFAAEAVASGAAALVCERPLDAGAPQIVVGNSLAAMNRLAAPFFGNPASQLDIIGVTGTNGKTTSVYMLEGIFRATGAKTGIIGTVGMRIGDGAVEPADRTTPESIDLQRQLAKMVSAGVTFCAMEVTSIGLERGRVEGTGFRSVVFTNLSQDHLDNHPDMEAYYQAKKRLFSRTFSDRAAINADDDHGRRLLGEVSLPRTLSFGMHGGALKAENVVQGRAGSTFRARGPGMDCDLSVSMPGRFNVSNALGAAGAALLAGIEQNPIRRGLATFGPVPGRMEPINAGQDFSVLVDYAHTPAALESLLAAIRETAARGRLILVFGCGGDRDRGKRPLMGRAAGEADYVFVTSDNPRSEDPLDIIYSVEQGLRENPPRDGYCVREDRRRAIEEAIAEARSGDVVIIAGKGHETGQWVGKVKYPFDDRSVALEALQALRGVRAERRL